MGLKFDRADRNYMRAFALGIGVLAVITLVDIGIATWVWASQQKPDPKLDVAFAASTPALLGTGLRSSSAPAAHSAQASAAPVASAAQPAGAAVNASSASAAEPPAAPPAASAGYQYVAQQGQKLFDGTCAACHQASGEGIPGVFPPLRGNAAVNDADPTTQLVTILKGRHGDKIGGQTYSGAMPPFAGQFSDVQIADIANYERSSWGNQAKHVSPEEVAALRAKSP